MKNKAVWLLLWAVICTITSFPITVVAAVSVSPAFLQVDLSKKNPSGTFKVTNLDSSPQTFRAKVMHFSVTEEGSIQVVPPDEYSLATWVKFNPKEFTLPPKSSRKVRFSIIRKHTGVPREYWGAIEFTPLSSAQFSTEERDGRTMQFRVLTKIVVPIYGVMEDVNYAGKLTDISAEKVKGKDQTRLSLMIENTGEGILRMAGEWRLTDKTSNKEALRALVQKVVVLPKQSRRLDVFVDQLLPAGQYDAVIQLEENRYKVPLVGRGEVVIN